jgi:hypothetical protein
MFETSTFLITIENSYFGHIRNQTAINQTNGLFSLILAVEMRSN